MHDLIKRLDEHFDTLQHEYCSWDRGRDDGSCECNIEDDQKDWAKLKEAIKALKSTPQI